MNKKIKNFLKRAQRVRTGIKKKSAGRLRLSVHRSGKHMYAQIIDDAKGETLVSASTISGELKKTYCQKSPC
jgi:large subunit ribosomal protein L18